MVRNFILTISLVIILGLGLWWVSSRPAITPESTTVHVAFIVSDDCETVTLFPRVVSGTIEPAHASLVELLKGPSVEEKNRGATTLIPSGVKINNLRQEGDTIYADFDEVLQRGVAGSCRVLGIRSQIMNTLKQFPNINSVVISIDGRTEDILQP